LKTLQAAHKSIAKDVYKHLGAANVVKGYAVAGAAGPKQLRRELKFWKKKLGKT